MRGVVWTAPPRKTRSLLDVGRWASPVWISSVCVVGGTAGPAGPPPSMRLVAISLTGGRPREVAETGPSDTPNVAELSFAGLWASTGASWVEEVAVLTATVPANKAVTTAAESVQLRACDRVVPVFT